MIKYTFTVTPFVVKQTVTNESDLYSFEAVVTAYTANEDETDSEPCIASSNYNICHLHDEHIMIAACPAHLPYWTIVIIGDDEYVCLDRMAKRFRNGNYFDLFFGQGKDAYDKAIQFGRQNKMVEVRRK